MRCKSRIDLYCKPATWQATDEGQQWRLYKLRGLRIPALAVFS
jgi:hypothetical protein